MIIYINAFIPDEFAGITIGPISFIRPQYKDDSGLKAHEIVHQKQFWRTLGFGVPLWYLLSKKYRLKCELEAYKVQMQDPIRPISAIKAADLLSSRYRLNITFEEALKLLEA